jgi:hypothetical protein
MFELFTEKFQLTAGTSRPFSSPADSVPGLLERFGGSTFGHGLYRVHDQASAIHASRWVNNAYPEFKGELVCFAFDWLGRQFALDPSRGTRPDFEVIMLEPGTGEALEVPVAFSQFHDRGLRDYFDACLAPVFFTEWMATQSEDLKFHECAGYKVPLFLGGKDTVSNLEVSEIDVYWSLLGDLRLATRHLAPGSAVSEIGIHD